MSDEPLKGRISYQEPPPDLNQFSSTSAPGSACAPCGASVGAAAGAAGNPQDLEAEKAALLLDGAQMVLTITGIFDPTPVSDGLDGLISLFRGDWLGVGIAVVSMIPYVGDLSKLGKLPKIAKTIDRMVEISKVDPEFAAKVAPMLDQLRDALKNVPTDKLPDSAAKHIDDITKKLDDLNPPSFKGKVGGEIVELPGVRTQPVSYTKRTKEARKKLRNRFNNKERGEFLKSLTSDPEKLAQLKKAGFNDQELAKIANGKMPNSDWQVHHKLPLDDGGTNSFDNLVLIKNKPYHTAITNEQKSLTRHLEPGQTTDIQFPIPDGFVYPP